MKEVISQIIDALNDKILANQQEVSCNAREIAPKEHNKQIAFIDGGNAELLASSAFSLQMIRIAALILKKNRKVHSQKNEFFALSYEKENKYTTQLFPLKNNVNVSINDFDCLDSTIKIGMQKADISSIAGITRRFAELQLAKETISKLNKGDIILLDGSLKCKVTGEEKYMNSLLSKAEEKEIIVCALSKTSDSTAIPNINLDKASFCQLADAFLVKLNNSSRYCFQFEINNKERITEALEQLAKNSSDAIFPGYPYGLLLADQFARISGREKDYLITMFQIKAGKLWERLKQHINTKNAHSILDSIC